MNYQDTSELEKWLWNISSLDDKDSFEQLFNYFYKALCIYAKRFILDPEDRESIVQDVFCSIWINRKKINCTVSIRNYLITCVRNQCLKFLRDTQSHEFCNFPNEDIPIYSENCDESLLLDELERLLSDTLAKLPEEYRMAFEMSRFENKSSTEIAQIMNVSVRTVERYRNKALEILKSELKDYLPLLVLFSSRFNIF